MKRLLFSSLDLPTLNCEKLVQELSKLPKDAWGRDPYRNTLMLPILTREGAIQRTGIRNITLDKDFFWTDHAPQMLRDYFENHIFTWMKPRPRIMILKTEPGEANYEHIDCTRDEFGRPIYKFRYVLQGHVEDLYFLTKSKKNIYAPKTNKPFIMDGTWPHGMENRSTRTKFTLCAGAPWDDETSYPFLGSEKLFIHESELPDNYDSLFEDHTAKLS